MNKEGSLNNVFLQACQNGVLSQIAQNLFNVVDTSDILDTNVVEKVDGCTANQGAHNDAFPIIRRS